MIKFDTVLKDLQGKPFRDLGTTAPMTAGSACKYALTVHIEGERVDGPEKFKRFELAQKISLAKDELSAEEVAMAKSVTGIVWSPGIIGPLWKLLDPSLNKNGRK